DEEDGTDRQPDAVGSQTTSRRGNRRDPRRDAHCYGQDIAGEQRRGREQTRFATKIVFGHDIRATTVWIRIDRLTVGKDDDPQQRRDRDPDRDEGGVGGSTGNDQDQQDLFSGIGGR